MRIGLGVWGFWDWDWDWYASETDDILNTTYTHTCTQIGNHTWLHTKRQQMLSENQAPGRLLYNFWHGSPSKTPNTNAKRQTKGQQSRWVWIVWVGGWGLAMGNFWVWRYGGQCVCIGKPQEHQLMADKLNFAVLNGQSMRRSMV